MVEDSGGFPIQFLPDLPAGTPSDDPKRGNIQATVSHPNGNATKAVSVGNDGKTIITYELPSGEYKVKAAEAFVSADIGIGFRGSRSSEVNQDTLPSEIDVNLTLGNAEVTMVVPVRIQLEIGPPPNLKVSLFDTNNDGKVDEKDPSFLSMQIVNTFFQTFFQKFETCLGNQVFL